MPDKQATPQQAAAMLILLMFLPEAVETAALKRLAEAFERRRKRDRH